MCELFALYSEHARITNANNSQYMILYIISAAIVIMVASLAGVLLFNKFTKGRIEGYLPHLISFSAGVFVFTVGFLIIEALHALEHAWVVALFVLAGFAIAKIIDIALPHFHHHHDNDCGEHTAGKRVLIGDAIHNVADGIILVPAFMVSPWLGLGTALSIFVHEFLQELSEFLVLKHSGYSTNKALLYNFLVSATILIGVGIGLMMAQTSFIEGALLAASAGFFLQLLFSDLLPHRREKAKQEIALHAGIVLVGVLLLAGINSLFSHGHNHEAEEHDDHRHSEEVHEEGEQTPDENEHRENDAHVFEEGDHHEDDANAKDAHVAPDIYDVH